jgi:hypothetical protein
MNAALIQGLNNSSNFPEPASAMKQLIRYLGSLWKGHEPCWVAYWIFGVGITNLINFVGEKSLPADPTVEVSSARMCFAFAVLLLLLVHVVFMSVSVWRCAPNASHPVWTFLARAMLVVGLVVGGMAAFRGI